jgi:hypothetical protein
MPENPVVADIRKFLLLLNRIGEMSWMERLLSMSDLVNLVLKITRRYSDYKLPDERINAIKADLDACIGSEEQAVFGTGAGALIKINVGLMGETGFEMLTDVILEIGSKAIAKGIESEPVDEN